jgi:hypothetical protein
MNLHTSDSIFFWVTVISVVLVSFVVFIMGTILGHAHRQKRLNKNKD